MKVFVTGASGYIGGSLVEHLRDQGCSVTGLVRDESKATYLRNRGIMAVVGSLSDRDILAQAATQTDVVINVAESDSIDLVRNLLAVLEGTGKGLIHTSGSSIVADDAQGAFAGETILLDDMPYKAMAHRLARIAVDVMVRTAGITGGLRSAIVCPSTVYGEVRGWKRDSHQIPLLIAKSIEVGAGVFIGSGLPIWSNVYIRDLLDLYVLAAEKAPSGAFFFAENGEASWREIGCALSTSLGFGGRTQSLTLDEAVTELGAVARIALASNCRVRSTNARRLLGWQPDGPSLADAVTASV